MPFSLTFALNFGSGNTGRANNIAGQLVDTSGANVGSALTSGYIERASTGTYLYTHNSIPDVFRGGAFFTLTTASGSTVTIPFAINPQEAEFTDVKTSSVGSMGQGSNTVTLTVQAVGGAPVPNAAITIKNTAETGVAAYALTNMDGTTNAPFQLNAGTYHVLVNAGVGYQSLAPQTLIVSGTTAATYTLTPQATTPPSSLTSCRVSGTFTNPDLTAAANVPVVITIETPSALASNGQLVDVTYVTTEYTDTAGYFEVDLMQTSAANPAGAVYRIVCDKAKFNKTTALTTSTLDISTLL